MTNLPPNRSIPDSAIIPELAYPDVAEAVAFLSLAFGFVERLRIFDHRAQMTFDGGAIVVMDGGGTTRPSGHRVMVRVPNARAIHDRAKATGAKILSEPSDQPFGERQFSVEDPGGHVWVFTETIADVDPASWGGELRDSNG